MFFLLLFLAFLVISAILLLAGNVLLPVFLRWYLVVGKYLCKHLQAKKWEEAFEWTLRNPRRVTTHVFLPSETSYLAYFALFFNMVVLILFMSVELHRQHIIDQYGPWGSALGVGIFQILNLRHSGFTSIAMLDLTQGTLLVFGIAMYLSPLPFIGLLKVTGERSLMQVQGIHQKYNNGTSSLINVLKKVVVGFWFFKFALLYVLTVVEQDLLQDNPEINVWYLTFELVS